MERLYARTTKRSATYGLGYSMEEKPCLTPFPSSRTVDPTERKEWADEAKELSSRTRLSREAILRLRKQWHAEKMATSDEKVMVHLTLKQQALEAIPQQLQILINDLVMALARKK